MQICAHTLISLTNEAQDIRLRPVEEPDLARIDPWLSHDDIVATWNSAEENRAEIRIVYTSPMAASWMIENKSSSSDFAPCGYLHCADLDLWVKDSEGKITDQDVLPLIAGLPLPIWDIDIFIAPTGKRGHGIGRQAINLVSQWIWQQTPAQTITLFTGAHNKPARNCYRNCGFIEYKHYQENESGSGVLYVKERV